MPWAPLSPQCSPEACVEETHTPLPPLSPTSLCHLDAVMPNSPCCWLEPAEASSLLLGPGSLASWRALTCLKACLRMAAADAARKECVHVRAGVLGGNEFSESLGKPVLGSGQSWFWSGFR